MNTEMICNIFMNFVMACIVMARGDCMEAPWNQFLITACILIPSINDAESGQWLSQHNKHRYV